MKTSEFLIAGSILTVVFAFGKKSNMTGIGAFRRINNIDSALKTIYKTPNGKERSINDALYFGVGPYPYAYIKDLENAGVFYQNGKNALFGHLTNKSEAYKFLLYLQKNDGGLWYD